MNVSNWITCIHFRFFFFCLIILIYYNWLLQQYFPEGYRLKPDCKALVILTLFFFLVLDGRLEERLSLKGCSKGVIAQREMKDRSAAETFVGACLPWQSQTMHLL